MGKNSPRSRVSDLEYGDPSEADIVERNGAEKRVVADREARAVVPVPVDAAGVGRRRRRRGPRVRLVPRVRQLDADVVGGQVAALSVEHVWRQLLAFGHTVLVRLATDVVPIVLAHVILAQVEPAIRRKTSVQSKCVKRPHRSRTSTFVDLIESTFAVIRIRLGGGS